MVAPNYPPERALKRSEELLTVGQASDALTLLHGVATKRNKIWQAGFEPLMLKLVELAVELKKGRLAKEALHMFKNLCQNNGTVDSLERVLTKFLTLSESRVENAREKSQQIAIDIEDLEASETPESIMMSTVTDEDTKDRTDREYLTPWLKFLWETYRTILDVIRNNTKAEALYQSTAQGAFRFCLKYNRKTEFRRLCEILRNHLDSLEKYGHLPNAISLSNFESLQFHLDTRFVQLNVATSLELWQEAFKSIEDIHKLMQKSKKAPKLVSQSEYYEKLSQVFFVAGNYLMHAFSLKKLFTISKQINKNMAPEEKKRMASLVLLAALSIPVASTVRGQYGFLDADEQQNRNAKLASLLELNTPPSREQLLKELVSKDLSEHVIPEISQLYHFLEIEFIPLSLSQKVTPIVEFLKSDERFAVYAKAIQDVTLTRILLQLGEVYKTIKVQTLADLVPFVEPISIEKFIMEGCKRGDFQIRINHGDQTVTFGVSSLSAASDESLGGARLQTVDIRSQVARLSKKLHEAVAKIDPTEQAQRVQEKTQFLQAISSKVPEEHARALERLKTIEQRKIEREKYLEDKERKEQQRRAQLQREEAEAEKARLEGEAKKRDQELRERQKAEIAEQLKRKVAEELKKKSESIGIKIDISELKDLPPEALVAKQVQQIENEKREMKQRLSNLFKKIDHLERALREEEIPLLKRDAEEQKKNDREYHEKLYQQTCTASKAKHEKDMEVKAQVIGFLGEAEKFRDMILSQRRIEHQRKVDENRKHFEQERARRREQEERERRREQEERERRETEAREKAEREAREKAEKERQRELKAKEQEERQRKLDEVARKQREREAEIERKLKEKELASRQPRPAPAAAAAPAKEPAPAAAPAADAAAASSAAPAKGKYVPLHLRRQAGAGDAPPKAESPSSSSPSSPAPRERRGPGERSGGW